MSPALPQEGWLLPPGRNKANLGSLGTPASKRIRNTLSYGFVGTLFLGKEVFNAVPAGYVPSLPWGEQPSPSLPAEHGANGPARTTNGLGVKASLRHGFSPKKTPLFAKTIGQIHLCPDFTPTKAPGPQQHRRAAKLGQDQH